VIRLLGEVMRLKKIYLLTTVLTFSFHLELGFSAENRPATFIGTTGARPVNIGTNNLSNVAQCLIAVVNVGGTNQRIERVDMLALDRENNSSSFSTYTSGWQGGVKVSSTDPSFSTSCLGSDGVIAPGEYCIFKRQLETIPFDGNWAVCNGRIFVSDINNSSTGQVIASGAIRIVQEARVLGGVLSAANYMSAVGSTYDSSTDNILPNPTTPGGYDSTDFVAVTMNHYCMHACMNTYNATYSDINHRYPNTITRTNECMERCGVADYEHNSEKTRVCRNVRQQARLDYELKTDLLFNDFYSSYDSNATYSSYYHPFDHWYNNATDRSKYAWVIRNEPDTATTGYMTTNGSFGMTRSPGGMHCQEYKKPPSFTNKRVNTSLAGGAVYEVTIGGYNTICSGNGDFYEQGGRDFTYTTAGMNGPDTSAGNPPQRLICNQRHDMPDLYMGVGQTTTFSINGGDAF
tara:strand:- start:10421 stop:11803 length:1383 start_codon:yes stop_codon:yes gene_type:complete